MGLNDEREKLRQAEEWLASSSVRSEQFRSAFDHVTWTYTRAIDLDADRGEQLALRDEAARILAVTVGLNLPGSGATGESLL